MATALPGAIVGDTRGSVGNTTFRVLHGQQIVQDKPVPPTHTTAPAQAAKARFRRAASHWWQAFPLNAKGVWGRYAEQQRLPKNAAWTRALCDWQLDVRSEVASPSGLDLASAVTYTLSGNIVTIRATRADPAIYLDGFWLLALRDGFGDIIPGQPIHFVPAIDGNDGRFDLGAPVGDTDILLVFPWRQFATGFVMGRGYPLIVQR